MTQKIDLSDLPPTVVKQLFTRIKQDPEVQSEHSTYITYNYNTHKIYLHHSEQSTATPTSRFIQLKIEEHLLSFLQEDQFSEENQSHIRAYLN